MSQPRLRSDLVFVEQTYRGEQSYIVKDPQTHKYFRFRPIEALVMQELDGVRTATQIAAGLQEQGLPFTAAAVEGFARKLQHMELLERSVVQRSVLLLERLRAERHRRLNRTHYNGSLLRMRWSVGDPDRLFDRWMPRMRFFFSRPFLAISVGLFITYFAMVAAHWTEVSGAIGAFYGLRGMTVGTFLLIYLLFLLIVVVHEFGHGFTCKYFGGQVHEMGAMLMYFQPAFYCNVNDAWSFPDLRARLWVTVAGSWIQMVFAAIAGMVWLVTTPGTLLSQIALYIFVLAGITTLVVNANPLIPLDGYYALSDYLEIPNLRKRAFAHLAWLVKRYLLRLEVPAPPATEREKRVFAIYGPAAFAYSAMILLVIAAAALGWVSRTVGALGVLAFAFALWAGLRGRILAGARTLANSYREHRATWRSPRLWRRGGSVLLVVLLASLLIPWPIAVHGEFAAATPLRFAVTAPEGGVIAEVYAREGQRVPAGQPLVRLRNLGLERDAVALRRIADSLAAREVMARVRGDETIARRFAAERASMGARLGGLEARLRAFTLRAPTAGTVVTPRIEETVGRWVPGGAVAVRLDAADSVELRVVLERAGATWVRPGQPAALISHANVDRPFHALVASVAAAADAPGSAEVVEARVRVARDAEAPHPGVTGEAKITVRQSNLLGALWWAARKRVRSDLLL